MNTTIPDVAEHWEHFYHGADIGVRGCGPSKASAFTQAALALMAVIVDLKTVEPKTRVKIVCAAESDDLLFFDWMNALVFEVATRQMLFSKYFLTLGAGDLEAEAWGEPVDISRHEPAVEIKGATFTELRVGQDGDGNWLAQCVVDV
ncbi:MAG: archease [Limisphaerales bacterium]